MWARKIILDGYECEWAKVVTQTTDLFVERDEKVKRDVYIVVDSERRIARVWEVYEGGSTVLRIYLDICLVEACLRRKEDK